MNVRLFGIVLMIVCVVGVAQATDTSPPSGNKGYEIAKKSEEVLFAYESLEVQAKMALFQGERQSGSRAFELTTSEAAEAADYDKGHIRVISPRSLDGIVLLSWSSATGDEQQWIHTPRIKQTRRIGDNSRKAKFINSNFTYEDLLRFQLSNYTFTYLQEEPCLETTCQLVQAKPHKAYSNYSKLVIRYDDQFRIVQVDYFDKFDRLKKQLFQREYTQFEGRYWQPAQSEMIDLQDKTKTVIHWSNFRFNESLNSLKFDSTQLGEF